jgi:hypothetical protein
LPADIVRWIYELLAFERRSCQWIAAEFNRLGIPTTDPRDARRRKNGTRPMKAARTDPKSGGQALLQG